MPGGVENSSLRIATMEDTRGNDAAESVIDERSEVDEEKNESEIANVNFGMFCRNQISRDRADIIYMSE